MLFSWAVLVLKTIFPFANRHLYAPGKSSEKIGDINYGSTVFYDALGLAFSLSALERRTLQASSPKPLLKKKRRRGKQERRKNRHFGEEG